MSEATYSVSRNRLLLILPRCAVGDRVPEPARERPLVALLTSRMGEDLSEVEPVIRVLLDNGCEYFVCFGPGSEALHDRIDELSLERLDDAHTLDATTTWHDDETPDDVAEFFFNVAGSKKSALLVAVLEAHDVTLADALVRRASVQS